MKANVHVVYCGAWGYEAKFRAFAASVSKEGSFDDADVTFTSEATAERSGKFEVCHQFWFNNILLALTIVAVSHPQCLFRLLSITVQWFTASSMVAIFPIPSRFWPLSHWLMRPSRTNAGWLARTCQCNLPTLNHISKTDLASSLRVVILTRGAQWEDILTTCYCNLKTSRMTQKLEKTEEFLAIVENLEFYLIASEALSVIIVFYLWSWYCAIIWRLNILVL